MDSHNKKYKFTLIKHQQTSFYISEAPSKSTLEIFNSQLKEHKIKHIVRLCDPTYDEKDLCHDVKIHDCIFADGDRPHLDIIVKWLELLKLNDGPILIHCMAGLGRAPTILAIGLIELKMDPFKAVKLIRDERPGSINSNQLKFIIDYKPTNKRTSFFCKIFGCN